MKISRAIVKYLTRCQLRNYSPDTIASIRRRLRIIQRVLGNIETSQINEKRLLFLLSRLTCQTNTKIRYLSDIKQLLIFLKIFSIEWHNIFPKSTPPKTDYVTELEVGQLLKSIKIEKVKSYNGELLEDYLIALRDKALILFMWSSGLRAAEICSMRRNQIDFEGGTFSIIGKENKVRLGMLSDDAESAIKTYLQARNDISDALFYCYGNHHSSSLKRRTLDGIIKRMSIKAGLRPIYPHMFRHGLATHLLKQGMDIRKVQLILGHSKLETTMRYTHITDVELVNNYREYFNKPKSLQLETRIGLRKKYKIEVKIARL